MNFNHFWEKVGEDIGEGGKKKRKKRKKKKSPSSSFQWELSPSCLPKDRFAGKPEGQCCLMCFLQGFMPPAPLLPRPHGQHRHCGHEDGRDVSWVPSLQGASSAGLELAGLARGWQPGPRLLGRGIRCRRQQRGAAPEPRRSWARRP